MDIGIISAALSSLKVAKDISQALLEPKLEADIQTEVIDLQSNILSAQSSALDVQSEQFALKKRLAELETELAHMRSWEAEKQRYSLLEVSPGIFVFGINEDVRGNEPIHWLCVNCFNKGRKAILQFAFDGGASKNYMCQDCKSEIHVRSPNWSPPSPSRTPDGPQGWMAR